MKQSLEDAILKTVIWWSEAIQKPLNQNNGDNTSSGAMTFLLMSIVSIEGQKEITSYKIKKFEEELTKRLKLQDSFPLFLSVDYNPDIILAESANFAGIPLTVFPCKSHTVINKDYIVEAKMGYGNIPVLI